MKWVNNSLKEISQNLKEKYQSNTPFPHVEIDNLFVPELLESVLSEFPPVEDVRWRKFVHKHSLKLALTDNSMMGDLTQKFLSYLNGPEFLSFLETLTGIEGLVPDPYLEGGGLHLITRGGFLGIHADFNFHKKLKLHRRINLLIYLNHDWQEDYGSHLELWDDKMTMAQVKILPVFNRIVIFNTTDWSFHGHPDPLKSPEEISRKSIALYYYSTTRPAEEISEAHSTLYQIRPNAKKEPGMQKPNDQKPEKSYQKPPSKKDELKNQSVEKKVLINSSTISRIVSWIKQ